MNLTTLGIDLAKTSFTLVGMDRHGKFSLRKTVKRAQLLTFIAQWCALLGRDLAGSVTRSASWYIFI